MLLGFSFEARPNSRVLGTACNQGVTAILTREDKID